MESARLYAPAPHPVQSASPHPRGCFYFSLWRAAQKWGLSPVRGFASVSPPNTGRRSSRSCERDARPRRQQSWPGRDRRPLPVSWTPPCACPPRAPLLEQAQGEHAGLWGHPTPRLRPRSRRLSPQGMERVPCASPLNPGSHGAGAAVPSCPPAGLSPLPAGPRHQPACLPLKKPPPYLLLFPHFLRACFSSQRDSKGRSAPVTGGGGHYGKQSLSFFSVVEPRRLVLSPLPSPPLISLPSHI